MKVNWKATAVGVAALGIVAALAAGVGVAQATEQEPAPATSATPAPGYGHGAGLRGILGGKRVGLTAAAKYLGLSETELQARLQAGKSLADVAKDVGKPVSGLQDAIIAAKTSAIEASTELTAEQKTACVERVKSRITTMINKPHEPGNGHGRWGGHGGGHGHGGGWE